MKNHVIKVTIGAALFILTSFGLAKGFIFTSEEGKYSINFPTEFSAKDMSEPDYISMQVQATLNKQLFFSTHNIHVTELTDHEALAETSLNSFVGAMEGSITSQEKWVVNKNNGLKAEFNVPSLNMKGVYNVVMIGQIQYQVAVLSEVESWNQAAADKFLKSFKVKK
jgi:hypothetical protein